MKFIVWTTFGGSTTPILAENVVTRQTGPGVPGRYSIVRPQTADGSEFLIELEGRKFAVRGVLSVPEDKIGMYAEVEELTDEEILAKENEGKEPEPEPDPSPELPPLSVREAKAKKALEDAKKKKATPKRTTTRKKK